MVNYAQAKVYRLVNNVDGKEYVGSTCNPLHKRKAGHKRDAAKSPNQPVYSHLNTIGWENVEIILIENCPCSSKEELHARERHWIETLKPVLNKAIPTRTPKEISGKQAIYHPKDGSEVSGKQGEISSEVRKEQGSHFATEEEILCLAERKDSSPKEAVLQRQKRREREQAVHS